MTADRWLLSRFKPKGFDPVEWARYNELISGSCNAAVPAEEHSDVKGTGTAGVRGSSQPDRASCFVHNPDAEGNR